MTSKVADRKRSPYRSDLVGPKTPEEAAREILLVFAKLGCFRIGGTVTYDSILQKVAEPEHVEAGLKHAIAVHWIKWTVKSFPQFKLTEAGVMAAAQASRKRVEAGGS